MASPEDYGKRERIARFENKDTDFCNARSSFSVPEQIYTNDSGIDGYVLVDDENITHDTKSLHAGRCFCMECQKTFQTDININRNNYYMRIGWSMYGNNMCPETIRFKKDYSGDINPIIEGDVTCPECGKELQNVGFIPKHIQKTESDEYERHISIDKKGSNPYETNGRWCLPPHFISRQLFASKTDDGQLTRIDDQILFKRVTIDPDGTVNVHGTEIAETFDLLDHTRKITESVIRNRQRTTYHVEDEIDPFRSNPNFKVRPNSIRYFDKAPSTERKIDQLELLGEESKIVERYHINDDHTFAIVTDVNQANYNGMRKRMDEYMYANREPISDDEHKQIQTNFFTDVKAKLIEDVFSSKESTQDKIMTDSAKTGVYLKEHHPDSNETNTETDSRLKNKIMTMMVQYPAAFDYALERAHNQVLNYEMSQKRKAKAAEESGGHYDAKTMTDKGKAKFMRQELTYVAEQLSTMDNKLLRIVHDSPNVSALKANMAAVAFGDQWASIKSMKGKERELINDERFRINVDNAINDPVRSTKALVNKFNADMFGVTNTIYTCQKMGITNIDHINAFVAAGQDSPTVQTSVKTIRGREQKVRPYKPNVNAGTIKPIESKDELRLMRSFANTHDPKDVLEIYTDEEKFNLYMECVDLYKEINDKKAKIITADNPKTAAYSRSIVKNNLKSYLQFHSIEEAYVDHVTTYGSDTPNAINQLVAEIKLDKKMPEIQEYAKAHGNDAAIEQYRSDFEGTGDTIRNDPGKYIDEFTTEDLLAGQQIVSTRNGKDLFKNRSLRDIHDELSHINRHLVSENTSLKDCYPEEVRNMEKSYDCPDGKGQWSFHCHQDSFDVVRSSTQLHNCLGSSYVSKMLRHQSYVMYMQDETGQRIAAIEIAKKNNYDQNSPYEVLQFQADHDTALPARYADVAKQWLDDSGIDYNHNSDVAAFGRTREDGSAYAFYGNGHADYHYEEVDDTTGTLVNGGTLARRKQEREEMAKRLFNYDESTGTYNFGVDVPDYTP